MQSESHADVEYGVVRSYLPLMSWPGQDYSRKVEVETTGVRLIKFILNFQSKPRLDRTNLARLKVVHFPMGLQTS